MKTIVTRILAAVGLVPAGRYEAMSRRVGEIHRDRDEWKKRATKLARRERVLEKEGRETAKQLQRQIRLLSDTHGSAEAHATELTAMRARLAETERVLALTREQLSAIEVKLDILEGAANVLDARTRTAVQQPPVRNESPVA